MKQESRTPQEFKSTNFKNKFMDEYHMIGMRVNKTNNMRAYICTLNEQSFSRKPRLL